MGKDTKYLIIGDTIIDKEITLEAIGLSLETPTIKTKFLSEKYSYGGAANVARYLKYLGGDVTFLTSVSEKSQKELEEKYKINIINCKQPRENTKTRFYIKHGGSKYNHLQINDVNDSDGTDVLNLNLEKYEVIAFSDYRCGVISDNLIKKVLATNAKTFAASQVSSKEPNFNLYSGVNYFVCNEQESKLLDRKENVYITYGKNGSSFNEKKHDGFKVNENKIIGAGDCYYAGVLFYEDIVMANRFASQYVAGLI